MLTFKTGDVTKAKEKGIQLLVHCVNSGFYFGSGVAVAINNHFAGSVEQYVNWGKKGYHFCDFRGEKIPAELGEVQFVPYGNTIVCNCVGQKRPGRKLLNNVLVEPVRLWAMKEAMVSVSDLAYSLKDKGNDVTIIGPEFCGLRAGADFQKDIVPIIKELWAEHDVVIYQYEEK